MNRMDFEKKAKQIRLDCLRDVKRTNKGHLGGTFSIVDILVVLYYNDFLRFNKESKTERDKVIIGKGHANLAFFHIWKDLGLLDEKVLKSYGEDGGLGGQIDTSIFPADNITGSLGHAIGIASGISIANKLNKKDFKAIAIVGDGEMEEGSIWEALEFASVTQLNNLLCIIDRNRLSVTKKIDNENLLNKIKTFGWDVININGHNLLQIYNALELFFKGAARHQPFMIIADTIKGKGVSFMENNVKWHHGAPNDEEYKIALKELQ